MVTHERLTEAAIDLQKVFHEYGITNGLFGGFAVATMGGVRSSKDVDVLASVSKEQIVQILAQYPRFRFTHNARPDYAAFLWSDRDDFKDQVLVEIFPERFEGGNFVMANVPIRSVNAQTRRGSGYLRILDPVYVFKGKLRAAAIRGNLTDAHDLRWLEHNYRDLLAQHRGHFDLRLIGLALRRAPELENTFKRLGVDVEVAEEAAKPFDLDNLPPEPVGYIQRGLLKMPTPYSSRAGSTKSKSSSKGSKKSNRSLRG